MKTGMVFLQTEWKDVTSGHIEKRGIDELV